MRVLAAVLAHARDVAFDVAGIQGRLVEGRIEELDQRGVAAHEARVDGVHRHARIAAASPAPESTDQLCAKRIDLAFGVAGRAERRAVVEIGAAIPFAVPAVLLDVLAQLGRPRRRSARRSARRRAAARVRRTASARRTGRTPARRFRPCRDRRRGSCRRSSRRSPSAAGRARRSASHARSRARSARRASPTSSERPGRS